MRSNMHCLNISEFESVFVGYDLMCMYVCMYLSLVGAFVKLPCLK